jgi:hypothetical protein
VLGNLGKRDRKRAIHATMQSNCTCAKGDAGQHALTELSTYDSRNHHLAAGNDSRNHHLAAGTHCQHTSDCQQLPTRLKAVTESGPGCGAGCGCAQATGPAQGCGCGCVRGACDRGGKATELMSVKNVR